MAHELNGRPLHFRIEHHRVVYPNVWILCNCQFLIKFNVYSITKFAMAADLNFCWNFYLLKSKTLIIIIFFYFLIFFLLFTKLFLLFILIKLFYIKENMQHSSNLFYSFIFHCFCFHIKLSQFQILFPVKNFQLFPLISWWIQYISS